MDRFLGVCVLALGVPSDTPHCSFPFGPGFCGEELSGFPHATSQTTPWAPFWKGHGSSRSPPGECHQDSGEVTAPWPHGSMTISRVLKITEVFTVTRGWNDLVLSVRAPRKIEAPAVAPPALSRAPLTAGVRAGMGVGVQPGPALSQVFPLETRKVWRFQERLWSLLASW